MGEFAGYIRLDGASVAPEVIARLADSVLSAGPPRIWRPEQSSVFIEGLVQASPSRTLGAVPEQSWPDRTVLADGWLEAPREIADALGCTPSASDRALMAEAIMAWGIERAADRLYGENALALWEAGPRRLTLARDAFGARPIYYHVARDYIQFATTLQTMLAHSATPRDLDPVIVAHTMTLSQADQEKTIYRQIRRVPPGGTAVFEGDRCTISRYYSAERIASVRLGSDQAYVEAARELFDRAVACRLSDSGPYATELSGGFDSSGVAATAARLLDPQILTAYTRVPAPLYAGGNQGERQLAGKLAARYPNIAWTIIDDACEEAADLHPEQEAAALLVPRVDSYHRAWFESLVRVAQGGGAPILLNGGIGNITLSYHGDSRLAALPATAWPSELLRIHRNSRANGASFPRALAAMGYHGFAPRGVRRWHARRNSGPMPWLRHCLISPDFLAEIDYETHAQEAGSGPAFELPISHREIRLRILQSQRGRDSRGFIQRRWSIRSRDPYRDRKLAEFCLGIPNDQYYRDGQDRWLARRVLADRVPAEILAQKHRGEQVPEWFSLADAQRDGIAAAIERIGCSPAANRVLDMPRIRAALNDWPKDAEVAARTRHIHGDALQRAISMGGFLLWHETSGE